MLVTYAYENYYYRHLRAAVESHIQRIAHAVKGGAEKARVLKEALANIDRGLQDNSNRYHYYHEAIKEKLLPIFKTRRWRKNKAKDTTSFADLRALMDQIDRAIRLDIQMATYVSSLALNHQFLIDALPAGFVAANLYLKKLQQERQVYKNRISPSVDDFQAAVGPYGRITDDTARSFAQAVMPGLWFGNSYLFTEQLHLRRVQGVMEFACLDVVSLGKRLRDFDEVVFEQPEIIAPLADFFQGARFYPLELYYCEAFTTELLRLIELTQSRLEALTISVMTESAAFFKDAQQKPDKDIWLALQTERLTSLKNFALELTLWRIYKTNDGIVRQTALTHFFNTNPTFKLNYVTKKDGAKELTSHTLRTLLAHEALGIEQYAQVLDSWVSSVNDYQLLLTPMPDIAVVAPKRVYLSFRNFNDGHAALVYQGKNNEGKRIHGELPASQSFTLNNCGNLSSLTTADVRQINQQIFSDQTTVPLTWGRVQLACQQYAIVKKQQRNPLRRQAVLIQKLVELSKRQNCADSLTNYDKAHIIQLMYQHQRATKVTSRAFAPIVALLNVFYGITGVHDVFMYHDLMRMPNDMSLSFKLYQDFPGFTNNLVDAQLAPMLPAEEVVDSDSDSDLGYEPVPANSGDFSPTAVDVGVIAPLLPPGAHMPIVSAIVSQLRATSTIRVSMQENSDDEQECKYSPPRA